MKSSSSKWYWSGHDSPARTFNRTISLLPPAHPPRQAHDTQSVQSYQPSDASTPNTERQKLSSFGMEDSQQALVKQIRMINVKMGRDENAGIRKVKEVDERPMNPQRSLVGFHPIDPSPRCKPTLTYLKPLKLPPIACSLSPSSRISLSPRSLPLTLSERSVLRHSIEEKAKTTRESLEASMMKRLEKLNKLNIFPRSVNEFRVKSFVQFSLHREMQKSSLQEFIMKERERVLEARNKKNPERQLTKEVEANRRLLASLEEELVDKLAWVENHVPDPEDDSAPAIVGLTREQIDTKIAKMRADGKRRAPILAKTQALPTLNIAKELA